jgi:hypothetical protein
MELYMKDNIKMEKKMEKVNSLGLMEQFILDNLRIII